MSERNAVDEDFQVVVSIDVQGVNWVDIEAKVHKKAYDFFGGEFPVEVVIWTVNELTQYDPGRPGFHSFDPPVYTGSAFAARSRDAVMERVERALDHEFCARP